MMIDDPIVKEVRKARQDIFKSYGSLRAYHNAILEKQKAYGNRLVTLSPKKIDLKALHRTARKSAA